MKTLLRTDIQAFIHQQTNTSTARLALSASPFPEIAMRELVEQVEGWQKACEKIPSWAAVEGIIYPPRVSMEQCSSEVTARYKSQIINGKTLLDATGGFGVDTAFLAENFESVDYFEQNEHLAEIAQNNFSKLQLPHIHVHATNAIEFLRQNTDNQYDCIYIDPARRDRNGQRVAALSDCEPNLIEHLPLLFQHTENLLVKTAPMLDIKQVIKELGSVKEVHIVAWNNEVREVIYWLQHGYTTETQIVAVNLNHQPTNKTFHCTFSDEESCTPKYALPQQYLYEPNSAILKSGAFRSVCKTFNVSQLHKNSHYYTSETLNADFQGRIFSIIKTVEFNKKSFALLRDLKCANIAVRNFPETVDGLRKRFKINDGGADYLFFTTDFEERKCVIFCRKINS